MLTVRACMLAGLVPPAAAVFILGHSGAILMVTMLFMAVTSAGSAELVAVSSLFTYDLYKTYINKNANGVPLPPVCRTSPGVLWQETQNMRRKTCITELQMQPPSLRYTQSWGS